MPFLGWLDPVRAVERHATATHYRTNHDGRSLYIVLRDFVRNGASHEDLSRILGPFEIAGRIDPTSSEPLALDAAIRDVSVLQRGECFIEYKMSYWHVLLKLRDGVLVDHDPGDFEVYPDGLYYTKSGFQTYGRPPDATPLPDSAGIPHTYCDQHGPQRAVLVCSHIFDAMNAGHKIRCYSREDSELGLPDAWCHMCESQLTAFLSGTSREMWAQENELRVCCSTCVETTKQEG